ncbi:MAG: endonuclease/exonuclease/phosphatase family protein [Sphingobacteriaceae bacterium]|nr:MAG: endonuclease/exonuclease/phosphatase family protein [Sphingobacteriaceae bacterium]
MGYIFNDKKNVVFIVFIGSLVIAEISQAWILFPYTTLSSEKVKSIDIGKTSKSSRISILIANVLMKNRNTDTLIKMIRTKNPTLFVTMEVNNWWVSKLSMFNKDYPYKVFFPTDNTYGMCLYSQLPLTDAKVLFLTNKNVPSIHCKVTLANGKTFQLLAIHPVAPKPSIHPDNMGKIENGLLKAAQLITRQQIPTLVAGDFNDVAWSYNTTQFANISKLKDVRCGRGLYNTLDANFSFFRWPLDHVFVSDEFRVINLERLPAFGSDHYPFYAQLALP